jgi:hypothetical protein
MADQKTQVVTEALRTKSKEWLGMADEMAKVHRTVEGMKLGATAFHIGDPMGSFLLYANKYNEFVSHLAGVVKQGQTEFEQMASALVRMADEYDRADLDVQIDLNKIYNLIPNQPKP